MRELILLRHAHAEPATTGQPDLDRPLSSEGLAEANKAGLWLSNQGLIPDCVLYSQARRVRETLDEVLAIIGSDIEQRLEKKIYDATPGMLMEVVDGHRDIERLMMVGHNPGLEQLAALMHSGQSGEHRGMPPASVMVLSFPADKPIEPGIASLIDFWWP